MDTYEKQWVLETKMDRIAEDIEEMVLDAILSVLKKIKENNSVSWKSENESHNEAFPF
jgi:hypothetical protein